MFLAPLVAGARGAERRLPRIVVGLSAVAALAFAASDPDRRIAERNVDRWRDTGRLDVRHANVLGADATPAFTALPEGLAAPDGLAGANLARSTARDALEGITDADCRD